MEKIITKKTTEKSTKQKLAPELNAYEEYKELLNMPSKPKDVRKCIAEADKIIDKEL